VQKRAVAQGEINKNLICGLFFLSHFAQKR
jgi:hypothetical protein